MDLEQRAQAFYGKEPTPVASPAPDPFAGLLEPAASPGQAVAGAAPAAAEAPKPAPDPEDAAENFYGGPKAPTRSAVDWNELGATAAAYVLDTPRGLLDESDAGQATMLRFREGLAEAGTGKTLAAEIWLDAVRAEQGSTAAVSEQTAERELRQQYGARYEANIEAAQGLIRQVAQRCPEVMTFLQTTGLGNNPEFIKKVVAAARRRRR